MTPADCLRAANAFHDAYNTLIDMQRGLVTVEGLSRAVPPLRLAGVVPRDAFRMSERIDGPEHIQAATQRLARRAAVDFAKTGQACLFRIPTGDPQRSAVSDSDRLPALVTMGPQGRGAVIEIAVRG